MNRPCLWGRHGGLLMRLGGSIESGTFARILVAVNEGPQRKDLVQLLRKIQNLEVDIVDDLSLVSPNDIRRTDFLIAWYASLQKLRESGANAYVQISRRARVIVALTSDRLLEAAGTLHLADSWLFTDLTLEHLPDVIQLSKSGYTLMPPELGATFGLDELRLNLVRRLSESELHVLSELSLGSRNRDIARALHVSEAQAKSLVRSVLGKLHFRNRTEAGVFMARQQWRVEPRTIN